MTHDEKVRCFIAEMRRRGVNQYTAAPPAWRTIWALGLPLPPPHFIAFVPLAIGTGLIFGELWGLAMWAAFWTAGLEGWIIVRGAAVLGLLFGLSLAAYYRCSAWRLGLPRWQDYPALEQETNESS
jgi:hypothetical protein